MAEPKFTTEELAQEEWRSVVGYEGIYAVSSLGRARREAGSCRTKIARILIPYPRKGYASIQLSCSGKIRHGNIHTLMMQAFIGERPQGLETNHKDGNKTNNKLSNLEYVTRSRNTLHAYALGLAHSWQKGKPEPQTRGERNIHAKLTQSKVDEIRRLYAIGNTSHRKLGVLFGVERGTIRAAVNYLTWK